MARSPYLLLISVVLHATPLRAQLNDKGKVHLSLGMSIGVHATEYDRTVTVLGFRINERSTGGAATFTFPLDVQVGIVRWFSLGPYVEAGAYLDTNTTKSNRIMLFGLQPRFYIVNKDRFAWIASLQLGRTVLRIDAEEAFGSTSSTFRGGHIGVATGVVYHFSDLIGLRFQTRLLSNRLPLRRFSVDGGAWSLDDIDAELVAGGALAQLSLCFKF